jgi:hypothetical protein
VNSEIAAMSIINTSSGIRLINAFEKIRRYSARHALVDLAENMAAYEEGAR